jgi:hypothetical protein
MFPVALLLPFSLAFELFVAVTLTLLVALSGLFFLFTALHKHKKQTAVVSLWQTQINTTHKTIQSFQLICL